jgi:dimethylargininase
VTTRFTHAIVRPPSRSLTDCQLLYLPREPIDFELATVQHRNYVATLARLDLAVIPLPEAPDFPDAVFVEDAAVVLDELAILCRPGAPSRAGEIALMQPALAPFRSLRSIDAPGTLEAGDVLLVDRTLFVGHSRRTNREGIRQLRALVSDYGYEVKEVSVHGCLHLKSAVTAPAPGLLLANPDWIDLEPLRRWEILPVREPWAANTLPINGRVLVTASAPRTAALLSARGLDVLPLDIAELQKAEAALTCLSLLLRHPAG